jgi:glycosyltransferase involved in cell wall biosynthesis
MTESYSRTRDSEDTRGAALSERERRTHAPLVSVVIPCYNQAHFLGEAIESVLNQSYSNFEVVVVDDGSPDNASEVASRYSEVRLVRQENRGVSAARNAGLRYSEGEYVVFLDADDRLLPKALEVGVKQFEAHPECALVFGYYNNIAADGSPLPTARRPHVEGDHYLGLLHRCYIRMHTAMYRRSVFEFVGGFDTSLKSAEDPDMYLRIARRFPLYNHGEIVAEYRRRHGTTRSSNRAHMLSAAVAVLRSQWKYVRKHERYTEAYKVGMRRRQSTHGDPLVEDVRAQVQEREWGQVLQGALVLLRYYPRGLALLLLPKRHMQRRILARRLQSSEQELEAHVRYLEEVDGTQGRSESALAREHQEIQRLRKRIRRLEQRVQNLDWQAQNGRIPGTRKLLKRLLIR